MRYLNKQERFAIPAKPLAGRNDEPMLRRGLERDTRSPLRWDLPCPPPTRRIGHPKLYAEIIKVGRTSITVKVESWVRRGIGEEQIAVTEGIFTYVAIDEDRRPCPVPPEG